MAALSRFSRIERILLGTGLAFTVFIAVIWIASYSRNCIFPNPFPPSRWPIRTFTCVIERGEIIILSGDAFGISSVAPSISVGIHAMTFPVKEWSLSGYEASQQGRWIVFDRGRYMQIPVVLVLPLPLMLAFAARSILRMKGRMHKRTGFPVIEVGGGTSHDR